MEDGTGLRLVRGRSCWGRRGAEGGACGCCWGCSCRSGSCLEVGVQGRLRITLRGLQQQACFLQGQECAWHCVTASNSSRHQPCSRGRSMRSVRANPAATACPPWAVETQARNRQRTCKLIAPSSTASSSCSLSAASATLAAAGPGPARPPAPTSATAGCGGSLPAVAGAPPAGWSKPRLPPLLPRGAVNVRRKDTFCAWASTRWLRGARAGGGRGAGGQSKIGLSHRTGVGSCWDWVSTKWLQGGRGRGGER